MTFSPDERGALMVRRRMVALTLTTALVAAACGGGGSGGDAEDDGVGNCTPADCVMVDIAVSSEKTDLLAQLGKDFNASGATVNGKRIAVRPREKASGAAAEQLAAGWADRSEDPRPIIWSPASSAWGAVVDQRLAAKGAKAMAGQGRPLMNSPLVIAMPRPMAERLGWPSTPIGWSDILKLSRDPQGWATYGKPEWGPFRLGKTNPNFSTSGLHSLIAQNYAASGKTAGLTGEDLANPTVVETNTAVESAVVHYGDTTLTFLNNWYRADQRGNPFGYASAVAVEEKSVIDYNLGNPDGVLEPGEVPRKPRQPLVAVYPKEGTLFSDNPFYVLDAEWVSPDERDAARQFVDHVQRPENQEKTRQFGFRPGNPEVAVAAPVDASNGVDPQQPQTTVQMPSGPVMVSLLDRWAEQRKGARVLLVIDVSGSMGEAVTGGATRLDLAKEAAAQSIDQFKADDLLGLREFSTQLGPQRNLDFIDLAPIGPLAAQEERIRLEIGNLMPSNGTPLYAVTKSSIDAMAAAYDPARINAVVLLTDGRNEDGNDGDDRAQRNELVRALSQQTQGENAKPVRLFTIGYGEGADAAVLKEMAEATNGRYYSATSDPTTINKVFAQVISNF